MAAIATVQVDGLRQFNAALKKMDADLPKATRIALNGAVDIVADYAKRQIPHRSGKAAASVKARSTRTTARITAGGRKAPYYAWLDFGGKTGRKRSVDRVFYKEGRYLYPALRIKRDEFTAAMERGLVAIAEGAGVEVS